MAEPELMKENEDRTGTEHELTDEEKREMMIELVFDGDRDRFNEFCDIVYEALPEDTYAVIRGSSITNERYDDGAPFDASGPGTSDVDLTLVGPNALSFYILDAEGYIAIDGFDYGPIEAQVDRVQAGQAPVAAPHRRPHRFDDVAAGHRRPRFLAGRYRWQHRRSLNI